MLTFCFWQAALKLQKRNKRARDAAIVKEVKKVTPKSFTGLLPAGVKENVIAVEAFMRARDLDFKDGTDMKEITRDATFPSRASTAATSATWASSVTAFVPATTTPTDGFGKMFFPKKRVICRGCDKERFYNGHWKACVCVARCLAEHCKRTDDWR